MTDTITAPDSVDALAVALDSNAWTLRRTAVERVADALRSLPKPAEQERLLALLGRAARDGKWEVRRAVAEALDLVADPFFGDLADLLEKDSNHDVQSAARRRKKQRRQQVRADRRLEDDLSRMSSDLAKLRTSAGPDVARQAEETAWKLFAGVAGPIAHDINHALLEELGSIRRARQALESGPEAAHRFLRADLAERELRRRFVDALMDDLADFSNPSTVSCERVLLSDVVRQALDAARQKLRERRVVVRQEIDVERGLTVEAPRERLLRALTNVIKNAFEAIDTKGIVRVTAHSADRRTRAVIRVTDSGRGIDKRDLERVFLPGVTSKNQNRKPGERKTHSGWGLAVTRRFVERDCLGSISVESVLGRGTCFTLTVPVVRPVEGTS